MTEEVLFLSTNAVELPIIHTLAERLCPVLLWFVLLNHACSALHHGLTAQRWLWGRLTKLSGTSAPVGQCQPYYPPTGLIDGIRYPGLASEGTNIRKHWALGYLITWVVNVSVNHTFTLHSRINLSCPSYCMFIHKAWVDYGTGIWSALKLFYCQCCWL